MTKQELRQLALEKRSQIADKDQKSAVIAGKVIAHFEARGYRSAGIYVAKEDEVQTKSLIDYCFRQGIAVAIPKIEQGTMNFYWIESWNEVALGHFGILEPITGRLAEQMDVMVVPMVAFDESRNRIGYGKGYYDRYLAIYQNDVIGIAFEQQEVPMIPADEFDQRLALIMTEKRNLCE